VKDYVWVGTAGGHFEIGELDDPKRCVLRELEEETGLKQEDIHNLRLRYITIRYTNQEIRQNYYFFADALAELEEVQNNEGYLEWVEMDQLLTKEMPYTAYACLEHYLEKGLHTDSIYLGAATVNEGNAKIYFTELLEY
jgi:8-oxo-dGTP diphosphatase